MSDVRLRSDQLTAELLRQADLADGSQDGVIHLDNPAVRDVLKKAGITDEQIKALDRMDAPVVGRSAKQSDHVLDLNGVLALVDRGGVNGDTGFRRGLTDDAVTRSNVYNAVRAALAPQTQPEKAAALTTLTTEFADILDPWSGAAGGPQHREMTRTVYNRGFDGSGNYTAHLKGNTANYYAVTISRLQQMCQRATDLGDPELAGAIDKVIIFYSSVRTSTATSGAAELSAALANLQAARAAVGGLIPVPGADYSALQNHALGQVGPNSQYTRGTFDQFEVILASYARVHDLAAATSNSTNTAGTQLSPYFHKTLYRTTQVQRGDRTGDARVGDSVDQAIYTYFQDHADMQAFLGRVNTFRDQIRHGQGSIDDMMKSFAGTGASFQTAVHNILTAEQHETAARAAQDKLRSDIQTGRTALGNAATISGNVEGTLTNIDSNVGAMRNYLRLCNDALGTKLDATALASTRGNLDQAASLYNTSQNQLRAVDQQLVSLNTELTRAEAAYKHAVGMPPTASEEIAAAEANTNSAAASPYAKQLRTHIMSLRGQIQGLAAQQQQIRDDLKDLSQGITDARRREAEVRAHADSTHTVINDVGNSVAVTGTGLENAAAKQQEARYTNALKSLYQDGKMHFSESVFAGLIDAGAAKNGESTRLDLRLGLAAKAGVDVGVVVGVVGINAELAGFLETGIFVERGDLQEVKVGIDIEAAIHAGVSVEALFGLVEGGVTADIKGKKELVLRFDNSTDAARFLMRGVFQPVINKIRTDLPEKARPAFDAHVDVTVAPAPAGAVELVNQSAVSSAVSLFGRAAVPELLAAKLTGTVSAERQWTTFTNLNPRTGEGEGTSAHGVTTVARLSGEFKATLLAQSIRVKAQVAWRDTQGDPLAGNNGQYRDTIYSTTLSGSVLGNLATDSALLTELTWKVLGFVRTPPSPEDRKASGISAAVFQAAQTALVSQVRKAAGADVECTLSLAIRDKNMAAEGAPKEYETQHVRASFTYGVRIGSGDGHDDAEGAHGVDIKAAKVKVKVEANIGYERTVVPVEELPVTRGSKLYLLENAGTSTTEHQFNSFAQDHREASELIFTSPIYNGNVGDGASVTVIVHGKQEQWPAARINQFRASVTGHRMSDAEFSISTQIMYQLEKSRIGGGGEHH